MDLMKVVIAGGVGAGDILLEKWDEKATPPRTKSFQKATDIGRLIAVVGGHALGMLMPKQASLGETIATAATPLLVHSIYDAVQTPTTAYVPQRRNVPNRAPLPSPVGSRYPAPTTQTEFGAVRLV